MSEHMSAAEYRRLQCGELPEFQEIKRKNNITHGEPKDDQFFKNKPWLTYKQKAAMQRIDTDSIAEKTVRKHEEDDLTVQVADYCEVLLLQNKITAFSHIPQETFTKSWAIKNKNKAMGVRSGVPDMLIVYPSSVLFLELKKEKGGTVSDRQKLWLEALSATGKATAVVARGWIEAKAAIDSLLE